MPKPLGTEIKVGLFVSSGLILMMLAVILLGDTQSFFTGKAKYRAHFSKVDGLIPGAKVILGGVPVGTVDAIGFAKDQRNIRIDFSVAKDSLDWIRKDSTVEIATQGVLGDKYLSIDAGSEDQPALLPESEIPIRPSKDLSQFLNKGDQLMLSLNSIASTLDRILKSFEVDNRSDTFFKNLTSASKNFSQAGEKLNHEMDQLPLKATVTHLNHIFQKMDDGTGTLGALINDPGIYDELRALFGGANRNRIIRNLVRQTIQQKHEENQPVSPAVIEKK